MKRVAHKRIYKKQDRTRWTLVVALVILLGTISFLLRFYLPEQFAEIPFIRSSINSARFSEFITGYETNYFLNIDGQTNWDAQTLQHGRVISSLTTAERQHRFENAAKQVRANLIFESPNNQAVQYVTQTLKYPRYARYRVETVPLLPGESFEVTLSEDMQPIKELFLINSLSTADRMDGRPLAQLTLDESEAFTHVIIPNGPLARVRLEHSVQDKVKITWPDGAPGILFILGSRSQQTIRQDNKLFITIDEIHGALSQELPKTMKAINSFGQRTELVVWPEYENSLQNLQFLYNGEGNSVLRPSHDGEHIFKMVAKNGYRTLSLNIESAHPCHRTICNLEDIFLRNHYIQYIPESVTIPFEKNIKSAAQVFRKKLNNPEGLLANINLTTRPNAVHYTWETAVGPRGSVFSWLAASFLDLFDIENSALIDSTREKESNAQIDDLLAGVMAQFSNQKTEVSLYIKKVANEQLKLDYGQGSAYPGVLLTTRDQMAHDEPVSLGELVSSQALFAPPSFQKRDDGIKYIQMEQGDLWLFGPNKDKHLAYMNSLSLIESLEARNQGPIVRPLDENFKPLLGQLKKWIESRRVYSLILKSKARSTDNEELRLNTQSRFSFCHANHDEKFISYDGVTMSIRWPTQMENDFYIVCQVEESAEHPDLEISLSRSASSKTRFGQYAVSLPYNESTGTISIQKNAFQNWLYADSIPYLDERESEGGLHSLMWINHRVDWNIDDYLFLQFDAMNLP